MVADALAAHALSSVFCNECFLDTTPCFLRNLLLDDCNSLIRIRQTTSMYSDSYKLI